jgi:hypothetical protein
VSWIDIDADLAYSHARFVGFDSEQAAVFESLAGFPQAQIGNAPATTSRTRRRSSLPPASRSAKKPDRSARCAGVTSAPAR